MKKRLPAILTSLSTLLIGCTGDFPSYDGIDSSKINVPPESRFVIETCVDIDKGKQKKEFSPRYTVNSVSQTGVNNILEIGMTEVRYVRGDRQEQDMQLYCFRFRQNGNDMMNSHRLYIDVPVKWLAERGYETIHVPL